MTSRLDEIRQRLAAATPGPWKIDPRPNRERIVTNASDEFLADCLSLTNTDGTNAANAALIAAAPSDLAYLLGEVERLTQMLSDEGMPEKCTGRAWIVDAGRFQIDQLGPDD